MAIQSIIEQPITIKPKVTRKMAPFRSTMRNYRANSSMMHDKQKETLDFTGNDDEIDIKKLLDS